MKEQEKTHKSDDSKLKQERDEYKELAMRIKADFDNFRKQLDKEKDYMVDLKLKKFLLELVNILDSYELALTNFDKLVKTIDLKHKDEINNNYKGLTLTYEMLKDFLKNHDVVEITDNKKFDPNIHEALLQETTTQYKDKEIIEVLQKGYMYKDYILRTAKVKIANNSGEQNE